MIGDTFYCFCRHTYSCRSWWPSIKKSLMKMAQWHNIDLSMIIHLQCRFQFVLKFLRHLWHLAISLFLKPISKVILFFTCYTHTMSAYIHGFPVEKHFNLIYIGCQFRFKKGQIKAFTHCKNAVHLKGQNWELTNTQHTGKVTTLSFLFPIHSVTN